MTAPADADLGARFARSEAHPNAFGYHQVECITGPADADGEVEWSTSDMIIGTGWKPTVYDEELMRALFGQPAEVAPQTVAWAFACDEAPGFGVMLAPVGNGKVAASLWDRGFTNLAHWDRGGRLVEDSSPALLNALAEFQREVLPALGSVTPTSGR